ncbi:Cna B-type domain-containing protein [Granulicatella elegans]|uniref:Cna B-type domain-containing protein n=1 Tax=Granulicatella elegans TaxID=137732 RepID=UPI001D135FA7|nr:Cna B-type domain-containing protein [Granulicatella elegans]UEA31055.1 Cna B-type domain-containing protein [Granulicatella elegans]
MVKRKRKFKLLVSIILVSLLFLGHLVSGYTTFADNQGENNSEDNEYSLNLRLFRPDFSNFESIFATYTNYWMHDPEQKVFDQDEWALKDFLVEHELHIEGEANTVVKNMTYTAEIYNWDGNISFEDIKIPYNKVEVEYYNKDDGNPVEPYLLHYDLYLKKADGKMILKIPRLAPKATYTGSIEDVKLIIVKEIKIGEADPERNNVYLDGVSGDDSLDGKLGRAVKSFARAKEIATNNQKIKRIIVIGTTRIEGEVSLAGTNAKILRGKDFNDYLFRVESGKEATLSDIAVDGNGENNKTIEKSLVEVNSKAILNINDGSVLKNNQIKAIEDTATIGGAIYASSATINMTGGSVENNQATYGGGIYLDSSTMNFSGGTVQNNKSDLVIDRSVSPTQYYSAGGGILANEGSTINMSTDAKVLNNYAQEIGGGISLGSNQWGATNVLKMSGGTIDGNIAGSAGGGIFVQAKYFSGGASKAYIDGGKITNNEMDASGYTEKMFGGGRIYVNGANNNYNVQGANGELYLKNVVITDNESIEEGAGYASCPISKTKIYVTNGAAIYGNKTTSNVNEIYILCMKNLWLHGGNPEYDISKRMLGGVPYNWKNEDNSPLDESKHKGILSKDGEYLGLHTDEKGNELTANLKKVLISGNKSKTKGGGIGSNGTVTIGTEETTSVSVEKKWIEDNNVDQKHPESVTVKLIANIENKEYEIESRQLSEENNWKTTFTDLPTKAGEKDIIYSIKEVKVDGYTGKITGTAKDGFVVTNTREVEKVFVEGAKTWNDKNNQDGKRPTEITINLLKNGTKVATKKVTEKDGWKWKFENLDKYENGELINYTIVEEKVEGYTTEVEGYNVKNSYTPRKTSIQVTKAWKDGNNQDKKRPDSVTIELLADGKETGKKVVLTKDNNWTGSFTDLDEYKDGKKIVYTVKEKAVGNGYVSVVTGTAKDGFVVTNTREVEKVSVEGAKTWNDKNNQDGKRPTEITINLLKNGTKVATKKVTEKDGWKWKFENLDKYENGELINYTIVEEKVEGYTTEVEGYNVKNSYTPGKTSIQVTKAWKDGNNQDGKRPDSVTIELLADGKETGKKVVLTKDNNWTGTFTDLDEYKAGKKIEYTVKEEAVGNGYTSVVTGTAKDGFVVTNVRTPNVPPEKPNKELPKTGDGMNSSLYGGLMLTSGSLLLLIGYIRKKYIK